MSIIEEQLSELPEVKVIERSPGRTMVQSDRWSFDLEDELEQSERSHWDDARALVAFAIYMDELRDKLDEEE